MISVWWRFSVVSFSHHLMRMLVGARRILTSPLFVGQIIRREQQGTSRQIGHTMPNPVMQRMQHFVQGMADGTREMKVTSRVGRHDGNQAQPPHGGNPQFTMIGKVQCSGQTAHGQDKPQGQLMSQGV